MIDLRTEREKMLDERNEKICTSYKELKEQCAGRFTRERILGKVAQDYGLSIPGVRNILTRYNSL